MNIQYNININQYAAILNGLKLDIVDLAIYDFICKFSTSSLCKKIQEDDGLYFWIKGSSIIEALPLLNIGTKRGINKRICNLVDAGLIERHGETKESNMSLYKFGKNHNKMTFHPGTETVTPSERQFLGPGNESSHKYNSIITNNNSLSNSAHESEISLSSVVSLIEYYNKRIKDTGRRLHSVANISSELRRLIIEGIRQHGVVDVHKAIEIATTPGNWCMDNNKTLFFILAEDKIERILMGEYDNTTKSNNNENSNCNNSSRPEQRPTTEERQAHYRDYIAERIATGRSLSGEIPDSEMPF